MAPASQALGTRVGEEGLACVYSGPEISVGVSKSWGMHRTCMVIRKGCLLESLDYTRNQKSVSMNYKRLTLGSLIALWSFLLCLGGTGCSSLVEKKVSGFAANFTEAIRDNDDPVIVEQGIPSYLLIMDALVRNNPGQISAWQAAASLNSAYASSFVRDADRAKLLHDKAMSYGFKALCLREARLCHPRELPLDMLAPMLQKMERDDVSLLFAVAGSWAGWIQSHSEDWSAVADLSRVELLVKRVIELDAHFEQGMPYLYLGVLATVLPPALGGRPEEGKAHFEKAIALSEGKNLMAKVYFARQYARGVFDRELHDRILNEVMAAEPHAQSFTLSNLLARREAEALLKSADDYF